jgi:7-cyano-7-deazaguanine synthase
VSAIVLLSGGLDSAVALAMIDGERLALGFDYGQSHKIELDRAHAIARHYDTPFEVIVLPDVMPKVDDVVFAGRNMVFGAIAIAIAQARGFDRIVFGCNQTDAARFPDCRQDFMVALERVALVYGIGVATPLLHLTKRGVVDMARRLKVPIELTWSCYDPQNGQPCGRCLACETREEALR